MQKWQLTLNQTPIWLFYTFVGVSLALGITVFLLSRYTRYDALSQQKKCHQNVAHDWANDNPTAYRNSS